MGRVTSITKRIAIWGASGHATVVSEIIRINQEYEVAGFLDDITPDRKGEIWAGKPVLGGREEIANLGKIGVNYVAFGFGNCSAKISAADFLRENNLEIVTIIHPKASIADDVAIGEGAVIGAGVVIDPKCSIGRYVIVNNGSIICHGSTIDDCVNICPGVNIAGGVHVGFCAWIGIGSSIIQGVNIGERSFVGAGSVVVKSLPSGISAFGNPARIVREVSTPF